MTPLSSGETEAVLALMDAATAVAQRDRKKAARDARRAVAAIDVLAGVSCPAESQEQRDTLPAAADTRVELDHILRICRQAKVGAWGVLSTGEKLAAALVLNRPEWLAEMRYSILEAIDRVGPAWMLLLPEAARILADEDAPHG